MASAVDICNLALGHLGDQAVIASISPPDASVQAGLCATLYPIARDAALIRHAWSFATKRAALQTVQNTNQPTSWSYTYALPNKCLRPVKVLPEEYTSDQQGQDFMVETLLSGDQVIYTNTDNATLMYIEQVTDTTKFSIMFMMAVARLLASLLAGPRIKGSTGIKLAQGMLEMYEKVELPQAMLADAQSRRDSTYTNRVPSSVTART